MENPKIGDRKIDVCKLTGYEVEMEYTGHIESDNGHPGWLCLHNDRDEENGIFINPKEI